MVGLVWSRVSDKYFTWYCFGIWESLFCFVFNHRGHKLFSTNVRTCVILFNGWTSLVAQLVGNLPTVQETWVGSLGGEDLLEEGIVTHSRILAWRIPMDRGAWQTAIDGVTESDTTEATKYSIVQFSSVQSFSHIPLFETPWAAAHQASLQSPTPGACSNSCPLSQWCTSSNHFIPWHPFILLPSIFPSIKILSNEAVHIMRPKYGSFSFSISPSNEYPVPISFKIYWMDLLAVQGRLSRVFSNNTSIFQRSPFFIVQLSYPYTITGKIHSFD